MSNTGENAGGADSAADEAWASARVENGTLMITLGGPWVTKHIGNKQARLAEIDARGAKRAHIDASALAALDTAGAWLIHRASKNLSERGVATELRGADPAVASLIETVRRFDVPYPPKPQAGNAVVALIARVGRATTEISGQTVRLVNYLGLTVVVMLRLAV